VAAAEPRPTSATKRNDADAWLHLGEAEERLKGTEKGKEAHQK